MFIYIHMYLYMYIYISIYTYIYIYRERESERDIERDQISGIGGISVVARLPLLRLRVRILFHLSSVEHNKRVHGQIIVLG